MKRLFLLFILIFQISLQAKVYDCFTFFNEIELLKVRLEELYDDVDYFVIVEGTQDFSGNEKSLHFVEHSEKFKQYQDKIIHVVVSDFPEPTGDSEKDNWARQAHTRNCKLEGLKQCEPNDIIIISDLDEIPLQSTIKKIKQFYLTHPTVASVKGKETQLVCNLEMRFFRYQLNREEAYKWGGAKVAPYWVVKKYSPWDIQILHQFHPNLPTIREAGVHLSSMGGAERVLRRWMCHGAWSDKESFLRKCREDEEFFNTHLNALISKYPPVPIDDSFPRYIRENLDYFYSLGWVADCS